MKGGLSILLIGIEPDVIDYTQPGLPPGVNAEYVKAGLRATKEEFARRGDNIDMCMILLDGTAEASISAHLENRTYDCIIIGGGIRLPPAHLPLFETVVNTVHRLAPRSAIAFNSHPQDSVQAVTRALSKVSSKP
jgi:hypothetical protein